jgi:hypothetical protein
MVSDVQSIQKLEFVRASGLDYNMVRGITSLSIRQVKAIIWRFFMQPKDHYVLFYTGHGTLPSAFCYLPASRVGSAQCTGSSSAILIYEISVFYRDASSSFQ